MPLTIVNRFDNSNRNTTWRMQQVGRNVLATSVSSGQTSSNSIHGQLRDSVEQSKQTAIATHLYSDKEDTGTTVTSLGNHATDGFTDNVAASAVQVAKTPTAAETGRRYYSEGTAINEQQLRAVQPTAAAMHLVKRYRHDDEDEVDAALVLSGYRNSPQVQQGQRMQQKDSLPSAGDSILAHPTSILPPPFAQQQQLQERMQVPSYSTNSDDARLVRRFEARPVDKPWGLTSEMFQAGIAQFGILGALSHPQYSGGVL